MQKILKTVVVLVVLLCCFSVRALNLPTDIEKSDVYLCSDDSIYPIYKIKKDNLNYYFVEPVDMFDFDFSKYNEIESSENINNYKDIISFKNELNSINSIYSYEMITKLLYEKSLNTKFSFCTKDKENYDFDFSIYDDVVRIIKEFIDGKTLIMGSEIRQIVNKKYEYVTDTLKYYKIEFDRDYITSYSSGRENNYIVIGTALGDYIMEFTKKSSNENKVYSNDKTIVISDGDGSAEKKEILFHFTNPYLTIINNNTEGLFDDLCLKLIGEKGTISSCFPTSKPITLEVPKGIYKIEFLNDFVNDFNSESIAIDNEDRELVINWNTTLEEENIEFIPSDTLEITGYLAIGFLLVMGIIFVIKKHK